MVVLGPLIYWGLIRLHRAYEDKAKQLEVGAPGPPRPRSSAATWSSCSSTGSTWRRPGPSSTRGPSPPTTCGRSTSTSTPRWPGSLRRSGDAWALPPAPRHHRVPRPPAGPGHHRAGGRPVADSDTECTVLLPRRSFATGWQRFLHDRTADKISAVVSQVPHVSATIVPYQVSGRWAEQGRNLRRLVEKQAAAATVSAAAPTGDDAGRRPGRGGRATRTHTSEADRALARRWPAPARSPSPLPRAGPGGRAGALGPRPAPGRTSNLECVLNDGSGAMLLVFQGRPRIPGIEPGARLVAEGMVGAWGRRLAILNPDSSWWGGPTVPGPTTAAETPPGAFLALGAAGSLSSHDLRRPPQPGAPATARPGCAPAGHPAGARQRPLPCVRRSRKGVGRHEPRPGR